MSSLSVSTEDLYAAGWDSQESFVEDQEAFLTLQAEQIAVEEARIVARRRAIADAIIYVCFLTTFTLVVLNSRDITYSFWHQELMIDLFLEEEFPPDMTHIYKTFDGVATQEEFWQYMEGVLFPGLFSYDPGYEGMIYNTNRLIGNVRIRQNRVQKGHCEAPVEFDGAIPECYVQYRRSREATEAYGPDNRFTYRTEEEMENNPQRAQMTMYSGGGFARDVTQADGLEKNLEFLKGLQEDGFVDLQTRALFIDFTTYNANINMFCIVQLVFEFLPSGGILPSSKWGTVRLYRYSESMLGVLQLMGETSICLFLLYYVYRELHEGTHRKYWRNPWNYLDIVNLALFGAVIGLRVEAHRRLDKMDVDPAADVYYNFQPITFLVATTNNLLAVNAFLLWFKMFKYTAFSPRVSMMNRVIKHGYKQLASFILMFAFVIFGFAQAGQLAFGSDISGFRTFLQAIYTLLLAMLGDFDFTSLRFTNRALGPLFFFTFIVLVFLIILSMFLAIIISSYNAVYEEVLEEEKRNSILKRGTKYLVANPVGRRLMKLVVDESRLATLQEALENDEDDDGFLDKDELSRLLGKDPAALELFERYDKDGDDRLSLVEREHLKQELQIRRRKIQKELNNPSSIQEFSAVSAAVVVCEKKVTALYNRLTELDDRIGRLVSSAE